MTTQTAVQVTFSASYNQKYDKLYTYLAYDPENIKVNELVIVETADGLKKAMVKVVDNNFGGPVAEVLIERYGPLKLAFSSLEVAKQVVEPPKPGVTRL